MPDKFKNKYRISSARWQHWDYGSNAAYFITICTFKRIHYFGEILNSKMQMNEIGKLADKFWMEIPQHFSFVELKNFVVMPNHTHGILIINKNNNGSAGSAVETRHCLVSTTNPDEPNKTFGQLRFQNQGKNTVSSIIGSYKSVLSRNAKLLRPDFKWQDRFHDNVIRSKASFERIQNYITNNPKNWKDDRFNR